MASTKYEVRSGWWSPGLEAWICPDTAGLVPTLPAKELEHALKSGFVVEIKAGAPVAEPKPGAALAAEESARAVAGRGGKPS